MDTTPPSHRSEPQTRTKSASRLSKLRYYSQETGCSPIKQLSLDIVPSSPKISSPSPASTFSPRPPYIAPLRELMLLSPSQITRSKTRRVDRSLDMTDEGSAGRKKSKGRNSVCGLGSPSNFRRSRRRMEYEEGEEVLVVKPKKKRKSKKDKSIVVVSNQSPRMVESESCNLDRIGELINDLVMWRDVSKSSLWFGFGSLCFLSSCFTKGVNFSMFSFISQVGLLFMILSFFSNSLRQRDGNEAKSEFKLTEGDILKVGKEILPAANLVISKIRRVFSGEPAMTLKVVPFLLLGAEYGHLITLWRLSALGFFISFTCPKLYSTYSAQLSNKVQHVNGWVSRAWGACTHKKIVAASIVSAFWNLTSIRTRIFAAFLGLVVVRYRSQHLQAKVEDDDVVVKKHDDHQQQQTKELVTDELGSSNK